MQESMERQAGRCNALSLSQDSCQYILISAPVSALLYPLCVFWDGRCWSIRLYCVSELYTAVHFVFIHKELVSPPFTIYTESKQIVSIHWTGTERGTRGSVNEHGEFGWSRSRFNPTLRLFSILTHFTV